MASLEGPLFDASALIIWLAEDKGVDVEGWLIDDEGETQVPLVEFTNRLSSLAFGVTVDCGGAKTMLQVERGLSENALRNILKLCAGRSNPTTVADCVDVGAFLAKCYERFPHIDSCYKNTPPSLTERYSASHAVRSPTGKSSGKSSSPLRTFSSLLPSSPYDEEVRFEMDDEAADNQYSRSRASSTRDGVSGKLNVIRKKLSSRLDRGSVRVGGSSQNSLNTPKPALNHKPSPAPSIAAATNTAATAASTIKTKAVDMTALQSPQDLVEDLLRGLTRKPNLYFRLQVQLGWQEPYLDQSTARGVLAVSLLRDEAWLTAEVVKIALIDCSVRLTEGQIAVVFELVQSFADKQQENSSIAMLDQSFQSLSASAGLNVAGAHHPSGPLAAKKIAEISRRKKAVSRGTLSAVWFKLYLEHLRLHKKATSALTELEAHAGTVSPAARPPSGGSGSRGGVRKIVVDPFLAHSSSFIGILGSAHAQNASSSSVASEKTIERIDDPVDRTRSVTTSLLSALPKELARALSGRPHNLSLDELKPLLRSHPILTIEQVKTEAKHRVSLWTADLSARNDYKRAVRIAVSQRCKAISREWGALSSATKREVENSARKRVAQEKLEEILSSERTSGAVTLSLYEKFDKFCRATNYSEACSWTQWLDWYQGEEEARQRDVDVTYFQRVATQRLHESAERHENRPPETPFFWHESSLLTDLSPPKNTSSPKSPSSASPAAARKGSPAKGKSPLVKTSPSPSNQIIPIPPSPSPSPSSETLPPRSPSLGQRHGTLLRRTLAVARSNLMTAGVGNDATLGGLDNLLAPLDVGLPPESPRFPRPKAFFREGSGDSQLTPKPTARDGDNDGDDVGGDGGVDANDWLYASPRKGEDSVRRSAGGPSPTGGGGGGAGNVGARGGAKAVTSVVEDEDEERREREAAALRKWRLRKAQQKRELREKEMREEQTKQEEEARKQQLAKRHYKQWLRLNQVGRYQSSRANSSGKVKVKRIPTLHAAEHDLAWAANPKVSRGSSKAASNNTSESDAEVSFSMAMTTDSSSLPAPPTTTSATTTTDSGADTLPPAPPAAPTSASASAASASPRDGKVKRLNKGKSKKAGGANKKKPVDLDDSLLSEATQSVLGAV